MPEQPLFMSYVGCLRLRSAETTDTSRISRLFASTFGWNSRHFADLSVVYVGVQTEQPTLRGSLGCLRMNAKRTADNP